MLENKINVKVLKKLFKGWKRGISWLGYFRVRRYYYIRRLCGLAIFLYFINYFLFTEKLTEKKSAVESVAPITPNSSFKKCMIDAAKIYYNESITFFKEFNECIKTHISIDETKMDNFENNLFEEKKMFIPLIDNKTECKWLTIGVGNVDDAERKFKKLYTQGLVYGVEPDTKRQGNFSEIGKILPFGVGLEDTMFDVVLFDEDWVHRKVKVISLPNLLDNYVHTRFIHYLTIDIEGFEYKILESLVGNGKFANEGISFCQIDAELHNTKIYNVHSSVRNMNTVQFILDFLQDSSPYLPIFNAPYLVHPHQKVTFINVKDQRCETAFGFSKYLNK